MRMRIPPKRAKNGCVTALDALLFPHVCGAFGLFASHWCLFRVFQANKVWGALQYGAYNANSLERRKVVEEDSLRSQAQKKYIRNK
jgi:hypothetical protein